LTCFIVCYYNIFFLYFFFFLLFFFYFFFFFFSSRRRHTRSYGDWSSDVCSSDLQRPDLAGQYPATGVVLEGELALAHAQRLRGRRVEDLLDLLQLDEVVARADRTEAQPGQLEGQTRQFPAQPVGAAVPGQVDPAELLHPGQLVGVDPEPLGGEPGAVDGRLGHLPGGQFPPGPGGVRVAFPDPAVEL